MTVANSLTKTTISSGYKIRSSSKNIMSTLGSATRAKIIYCINYQCGFNNPDLQQCDSYTIISAALLGESLKLSPSPQLSQYYMVPFANKINHFQMPNSYWGTKVISAAIRSGQYKESMFLLLKRMN